MNMQQLVAHYGSQAAAARSLGVSEQVVSAWNRNGIPLGRQYEIQVQTGGKLIADREIRRPASRGAA